MRLIRGAETAPLRSLCKLNARPQLTSQIAPDERFADFDVDVNRVHCPANGIFLRDFGTQIAVSFGNVVRRVYRPHSLSTAAVIGGRPRGLKCWIVMMRATEPMINAAAINVRSVIASWANSAPKNTATIGFTYA